MNQQGPPKNVGKNALGCIQEMLIRSRGQEASEEEFNFLIKQSEGFNEFTYLELYDSLWKGFFKCAADGFNFIRESHPEDNATEEKDIYESSYQSGFYDGVSNPSQAFLRFVRTFHTLHLMRTRLRETTLRKRMLYKLLFQLEADIAHIFFPSTELPMMRGTTPEDHKYKPIPIVALKGAQRQVIVESGADIDVDEFFTNNPVLEKEFGYWRERAYEDDPGLLKKLEKKLKEIFPPILTKDEK